MDLNAFATSLLAVLGRIADAAEAGAGGTKPAAKTESKPAAKPAAKTAKSTKPANDRDAVKAILIKVKDTISKEKAQEVYKAYGYEAMSAIEEKDFDSIFADATKALAANDGGEEEEQDDL